MRAAVLTVLAGAALAVPAAPAAAAACAQGGGVTVVVDFASLGGGTSRQCAAGDPASGVAALHAAGFTTTRAAQEPGYFLCRINGKPANDPCQRTSPADAYWSYWHAKPGGTWTYSSAGPADYDPAPGSVEGWAFGAGKPPSSAPPQAAAASPKPAPTSPQATAAAPSAAPRPVAPRASAASRPSSTPRASAAASPGPTTSASSTPSPEAVVSTPTDDEADPPLPHRGTAAGPLVAAVVVAVLLALAAGTTIRRRRDGA